MTYSGGGTWEQIKDTFILAVGDTYAIGSSGGEASHTLTVNEMPSHGHSVNNFNTGDQSANHTHTISVSGGNHTHRFSSTGATLFAGSTLATEHGVSYNFYAGTNSGVPSPKSFWKFGSTVESSGNLSFNASATNNDADHHHNVPAHDTNSTGNNTSHNNMPPYITAYCWKRTA